LAVERLGTRDIPISELTYFPGNARRGNLAEIRKSVRRLGQYRSVVVRDTGDALVVLAGNHTVQAMAAEGLETASCGVIRCGDDEAYRVNISDNRLSDVATDDPDELVQLLSYLDDDYEGTGWTAEDVRALIEPGGSGIPDSADLPNDDDDKYREQYGVIVVCDSEIDQQQAYEDLQERGYRCRVVTT
jgi:hypothetical protein